MANFGPAAGSLRADCEGNGHTAIPIFDQYDARTVVALQCGNVIFVG